MTTQTRRRTVLFFEIVRAGNPQPRMGQQEWRGFLDGIGTAEPRRRTVPNNGEQLIGAVDAASTADHLLLARLTGEVPHQFNHGSGTIEALQLEAGKDVVHITTICFLPYGNIIGTLQGGFSAPRASAIANWLNRMGLPCGEVELRPVIHAQARKKLDRIEAISEFTVKLEPAPADSITALRGDSELGDALRRFGREHPDVAVTLSLKVAERGSRLSRRRRNQAEDQLRRDVMHFLPDLDQWVDDSGVVRSVAGRVGTRDPSRQQLTYDALDFLAHRITAQCEVPIRFTDGRSVDLAFAIEAVLGAARTHETELREAVGADY